MISQNAKQLQRKYVTATQSLWERPGKTPCQKCISLIPSLAEEVTLTSWIPPLSSQSLDHASLTNFCLNARLILLHPVPRHLRSSSPFSLKSLAFKLFLLQHPSICCGWKKAQRLAQKCKGKQKLHGKAWDFHSLREIRSPESHGNSEKSRVHNFPLCL